MKEFTANPDLIKQLRRFDREKSVTRLASLLTIPDLHANNFRIELLVHLACVFCEGSRKPSVNDLDKWLNKNDGIRESARFEDPVEDVFVSNVMWETGNFRIFEGLWECSDFFLQETLDCLLLGGGPSGVTQLKRSVLGLLQLSEAIFKRCELPRWKMGRGNPQGHVFLPNETNISKISTHLIFSEADLVHANITGEDLKPFILKADEFPQLERCCFGNSPLERNPLLQLGGRIIVALPTAISVAIRKYIIEWLTTHGYLPAFEARLKLKQADFIFNDLLPHTQSTSFRPTNLPLRPSELKIDEVWQRFDVDKYAHIIVLPGDLEGVTSNGFSGVSFTDQHVQSLLNDYINETARAFSDQNKGVQGIKLFICGGVGLSRSFQIEEPIKGWTISTFSLPNFTFFVRESDTSLLRLWKLCGQKDYFRNNIGEYFQIGDDLNLYAFWKEKEFSFVQKEIEFPGQCHMLVRSDFVASLRKSIRESHDFHAVQWKNGCYARVRRNNPFPYFNEQDAAPVYADPIAAKNGELWGVVITKGSPWWLTVQTESSSTERPKALIQFWEAFLSWLAKLPTVMDKYVLALRKDPVKIYFSIENYQAWSDISEIEKEKPVRVRPVFLPDYSGFTLHIPKKFRKVFMQPENVGERLILEATTLGILELAKFHGTNINSEDTPEDLVNIIMPNRDMRKFHFFEPRSPGAQFAMLGKISDPRFLQPEDQSWCQLGLASRIDSNLLTTSLGGGQECKKFLNNGVKILWKEIHSKLEKIDRESLITMALKNNEAILRDRDHWKETSKALISLYPSNDVNRVFHERESRRASSGRVSRVLVEMALCASPSANGAAASQAIVDEISAWIMQLLLLAQWSDAIKFNLTSAQLKILPNGNIHGDHAHFSNIIESYHSEISRESLDSSAQKYQDLYRPRDQRQSATEIYSSQFLQAFHSEFGLIVDDYIDIFAELWDIATKQNSVVIKIKLKKFLGHLKDNRQIDESTANSFLRSFSLKSRPKWDVVPAGFQNRDFYPWRNQRRLSLGMKPIVQLEPGKDGHLIYGLQMCGVNLNYMLAQMEQGWMHQESIESNDMKVFIGQVADIKGKKFEEKVEEELKRLGWTTRLRTTLLSLGGPDLGDIDVLAWNENVSDIFAIECKRLKPARTIGEIGELLSKFQGEAKDQLGKHLRRMEWLRKNFQTLQTVFKVPTVCVNIEPLLVTNRVVPIQFSKDLPIETNKVMPLSGLSNLLVTRMNGQKG